MCDEIERKDDLPASGDRVTLVRYGPSGQRIYANERWYVVDEERGLVEIVPQPSPPMGKFE